MHLAHRRSASTIFILIRHARAGGHPGATRIIFSPCSPCVYILAKRSQWDALCRRHFNHGVVNRASGEHGSTAPELVEGFTKRYGVHCLVSRAEFHATMPDAILREKQIKHWRRAWKPRLIEEGNPKWRDLYDGPVEMKRPLTPAFAGVTIEDQGALVKPAGLHGSLISERRPALRRHGQDPDHHRYGDQDFPGSCASPIRSTGPRRASGRPRCGTALEDAWYCRPAWVSDDLRRGAGAELADGFAVLRVAGRYAAPVPLAETLLAGWRRWRRPGSKSPQGPMTIAPVHEDGAITDRRRQQAQRPRAARAVRPRRKAHRGRRDAGRRARRRAGRRQGLVDGHPRRRAQRRAAATR